MLLKLYALIYRLTGYYADYARIKEYEHVIKIIPKAHEIANRELKSADPYPLTISDLVDIEIGAWQAHHGFHRSFNKLNRRFKK